MGLLDYVELEELQRVQDMFSTATGLAAIITDKNGESITKPSNFTDFYTRYVKKSQKYAGYFEKSNVGEKGAYDCKAGVMSFTEPIVIAGEYVANIIGGQVRVQEKDMEEIRQIAQETGEAEEDIAHAFEKLPERSEESVRKAAELIKAVINGFASSGKALQYDEEKMGILKGEVENMVLKAQDITLKTQDLEKISKRQNILSLNASIEAARAGDAGRGFNIVANQMGELAKSSTTIYASIITDAGAIHTSAMNVEKTFEK